MQKSAGQKLLQLLQDLQSRDGVISAILSVFDLFSREPKRFPVFDVFALVFVFCVQNQLMKLSLNPTKPSTLGNSA